MGSRSLIKVPGGKSQVGIDHEQEDVGQRWVIKG